MKTYITKYKQARGYLRPAMHIRARLIVIPLFPDFSNFFATLRSKDGYEFSITRHRFPGKYQFGVAPSTERYSYAGLPIRKRCELSKRENGNGDSVVCRIAAQRQKYPMHRPRKVRHTMHSKLERGRTKVVQRLSRFVSSRALNRRYKRRRIRCPPRRRKTKGDGSPTAYTN